MTRRRAGHTETAVRIPADWQRSAERIAANRWRKVLVLGASDRGKSTYCSYLTRALAARGARVAFVDADIGQKDVGPPATVSLAYVAGRCALAHTRPVALYFVGAASPAGHFLHMVIGTRRMVEAAHAAFIVIDTTGLIHGTGQFLKSYQIESLRPDVIVALAQGDELEGILRAHRHYNVLRLRTPAQARRKSEGERRTLRRAAFRRYFESACTLTLDLERVAVQRSLLFRGEPVADPRFAYAERVPEGIVAVAAAGAASEQPGLRLIPDGFERGLLCGLADGHGDCLGLGIVQRFDLHRRTASLLTPVAQRHIRALQLGEMHLEPDGREVRAAHGGARRRRSGGD